jgi:hypothetical protein
MDSKLTFWQEIRSKLIVRGEGWQAVVEELPEIISWREVQKLLQSRDQLMSAGFTGVGYIGGKPEYRTLDPLVLERGLSNFVLDFDICAMQWLYRYYVVEALCKHWQSRPLAEWPPAHLDLVALGLHFMVYMGALMCLFEEHKLEPLSSGLLEYTAADVERRVKEATLNLCPKAADYGESFRNHGLPGLIPRLWDKIARITQLKADNREANFENLADSVRDLLGYSLIALSLMLEIPESTRMGTAPEVAV